MLLVPVTGNVLVQPLGMLGPLKLPQGFFRGAVFFVIGVGFVWCCGGQVIFHGALPKHPDFLRIKTFIESTGLLPVWFDEFPLTDIGSIIEAPETEVSK